VAGSRTFGGESASYLRDVYVPRLQRALAALPEGDLWWRPHDGCLSVGTVLLHLEGNVRQWVLSGLGGIPDERDRAGEFAATATGTATDLMARLADTVTQAAALLDELGPDDEGRTLVIQGYDTNLRDAVYHVVEHFSWHTGQVVWISKARAGVDHDVAFYDDAKINAAKNG